MEQEQRQQIKKYISLLLRRKELIVICLMISFLAGIAVYLEMPKKYKATALIIYRQQTINPSKPSRNSKIQTDEMVSTLGQQVTSRSNLETIIKQHNLYSESLEMLPMEDVVQAMRKDIEIQTSKKSNVFTVSFIGNNPRRVVLVTNALAASFIEENLRFRYEKASETSAYVKDELEMAQDTLDKKEKLMRDYKLKHYNEMPQQLEFNVVRLNFLQTQLQNNAQGQRDLEQTRLLIQEQIGNLNAIIQPQLPMTKDGSAMQALAELNDTKTALENLGLKYTDNHPEIKKLTKTLETQQQRYKELLAHAKQSPQEEPATPLPRPLQTSGNERQLQELTLQLKEVSYNIANLKANRPKIIAEIEKYTSWINATPIREAEWASLTRDYEQLNNHYQQLVTQNLAAEGIEGLERRQKGSQFKIIDSAHLPEKPHTPKFMKIMLAALAAGAGLGGGLAVLLEALDPSYKDAMDIETQLGIPVLCSIPLIQLDREQKTAKIKSFFWSLAGGIATLSIILATLYLWNKGLIII